MPTNQHFLSVTDLPPKAIRRILQRAAELKTPAEPAAVSALRGKSVALLFEKPSLRTKTSFMVGIHQLGGYPIYLGPDEVGLGVREPVADVARVLSGYVDCIVARVNSHHTLDELAQHAAVPVVNALSDWEHPCQIIADLLTITEQQGGLTGRKLAYIGDGNNVARSLCLALPAVGMTFSIAAPPGYQLDAATLQQASEIAGPAAVQSLTDPAAAIQDADLVYTDVWTSMGDEAERGLRLEAFQGYTVDPALLAQAKPTAQFMHDMPAHYGEEVPPGMLAHPQSIAYAQAHNRKPAQQALLEHFLTAP